ncbi:hypothetical protein C8Q76DRAFT_444332 [Earliella scabrosa]|nr:hypothetical protein C8Q76DRAFT_444332 [Earliella scabrosa]
MATIDSPSRSPAPQQNSTGATGGGNDSYPPQRHAGAVGLGPEYAKGATTEDKLAGYKEELKGTILHKPDLVQHGHDLRTGDLKRKQEATDDNNPFQQQDDSKEHSQGTADQREQAQAATTAPEGTAKAQRQATGANADRVAHIG